MISDLKMLPSVMALERIFFMSMVSIASVISRYDPLGPSPLRSIFLFLKKVKLNEPFILNIYYESINYLYYGKQSQ